MKRHGALMGIAIALCSVGLAQETGGERVVVPARNSTHARKVDVNLMGGSIYVKGYAGKEVIVEGRNARTAPPEEKRSDDCAGSTCRPAAFRWRNRTT